MHGGLHERFQCLIIGDGSDAEIQLNGTGVTCGVP